MCTMYSYYYVHVHVGLRFCYGSATSHDWEEEEEEEPGVKEQHMRAELQRRIESRKPPFSSQSPSTDPIFHQVILPF